MRIPSMFFSPFLAIASLAMAQVDRSVDYGGLNPNLPHWEQTKATGMADVGISRAGGVWLVGSNGTIWFTKHGDTFEEESGVSGFGRISAGEDNEAVGAVGRDNHSLWFRMRGRHQWFQTRASKIADVAIGDEVWMAGTNGTIWYSEGLPSSGSGIEGIEFKQIKASGFCRVATHSRDLWAVGCNGTLWRYDRDFRTNSAWDAGTWTRTAASGILDVAADEYDALWLTGKNGSVWRSAGKNVRANGKDFEQISPPGSGFVSIDAAHDEVYAVKADGTVWRYKH